MDDNSEASQNSDITGVRAVREAWIEGVKAGDVNRLVALANDDVVMVFGQGRCIVGKAALRAELERDFGLFDFETRDSYADILIHDKWAVEFSEVESTTTAIQEGARVQGHSRVLAVFARQPDGSWKVARGIWLRD